MKLIEKECLADDEVCDIYEGIQEVSKVRVKALKKGRCFKQGKMYSPPQPVSNWEEEEEIDPFL